MNVFSLISLVTVLSTGSAIALEAANVPELMMDAFMRIVSDRMIGEVFFKILA